MPLDPSTMPYRRNVGVMAINLALGGTYDNLDPAIKFFKELAKNQPIVPKQTSYARVISGEIPILLDYDFNAYRAKHKDKANVEFVIPSEGTVVVPYVMGLVNKGPNAENGKKVLDFVLSDAGQAVWANAYLRPVRASAGSSRNCSAVARRSCSPWCASRRAAASSGSTRRIAKAPPTRTGSPAKKARVARAAPSGIAPSFARSIAAESPAEA